MKKLYLYMRVPFLSKNLFFYFFTFFKKWGFFYKLEKVNYMRSLNSIVNIDKKRFKYDLYKIYFPMYDGCLNYLNYKFISQKRKFYYITRKYLNFFLKKCNYNTVVVNKEGLFFLDNRKEVNSNALLLNIFMN